MNHVAIDLGSTHSQVCIRRADGTIELEKKHPTAKLGELMKTWSPSRVVLETSSEAFRVADSAKAAGHEVTVVPAMLAKKLGVGERGIKTDQRDARKLSEVSCRIELPSVHVPSEYARELRSILRSRETLIQSRTKIVNHVRGWLRTQIWKLGRGATATFPERVRSCAKQHGRDIPAHIEPMLVLVSTLNEQVLASDRMLYRLARENPVCVRLMTVPGVGEITALSFVAAVDDIKRFPHAHKLASYLGMTPGEDSSSTRQRRTSITKAGSPLVRRVLIQGAWAAMIARNYANEPMVVWAKQIVERRGKCIGVVALARKLTAIMFALWRDGTTYRRQQLPPAPRHGGASEAPAL